MLSVKTEISKKTGAFALIDSLIRNGTKHIFGYPGGAILPLYDELYLWEEQELIQHILAYFSIKRPSSAPGQLLGAG